jgi:hypothetical protein
MEIGLWDHQPVSVCVFVCVSICLFLYQLLNQLVDFREIWQAGDAIQGDLDVIIINPIASTFLKRLRFKILR